MTDVRQVTPASKLTKALVSNSVAGAPAPGYLLPTQTEPSSDNGVSGIWNAGKLGSFAANRIKVLPYCEGPENSQFWIRLYGWEYAANPNADSIWIPVPLVQVLCTAGNLPGPINSSNLVLTQTENLCKVIGPVDGSVGRSGEFVWASFGAAYFLCELRGCQKFQFEFQTVPDFEVTMNAFWALA